MATKYEKAILDRRTNTTNNLREHYYEQMLKCEKEINDLKKKIADGDASEETKQKLKDAEEELVRVRVGHYENRY